MKHLPNLFKLLQLTRTQVQHGFTISGLYRDQLPDLAQHHYLVTFIAWQLATNAQQAGAKIDVQKVMELTLVHDLGEIFGSDISRPYALANPKARKAAKAFEAENLKFMAKFFGSDKNRFKKMFGDIFEPKSDEALIAKVADYVEVIQYMLYLKKFKTFDLKIIQGFMHRAIGKVKDPVLKQQLAEFAKIWYQALQSSEYRETTIAEIINAK